jgi:6-phosphogluconolactonase (cycloisomerase 2 family)
MYAGKTFAAVAGAGLLSLAGATPALATPFAPGAVYTSTNAVEGNQVAVFDRAVDGTATFAGYVDTGGFGTGAGLGNQEAVLLSEDARFLYVVNAGSNDISAFAVAEDGLTLIQTVGSGGLTPVSIAQHGNLVYVLNAGDDTVYGFRQRPGGRLAPIEDSLRSLAGQGSAPAQIGFGPDGRHLYVTEKATNQIDVFRLGPRGVVIARDVLPSPADTPFGFAFGARDQLFVSEANAGAEGASTLTSYETLLDGRLFTIDPAVPSGETAACWVVVTPGGRLLYVSNTGSDSVSSYRVGFDGELELLDPLAATTGDQPLDMAITPGGRFFYVLNAGSGTIGDYVVEPDGSLTGIPGTAGGLPASVTGLAAW